MKLDKAQEKDMLKAYQAYWQGYLKGDVKSMASLLAKDYTQVGSAASEVFNNKKKAVQFLYDTIDQVAGKLDMRNRVIKWERQGNFILVHEQCDLYALVESDWVFYAHFRASSLMAEKKGGWKFIHQHSSFPDTKTDIGQNIAIDKIAEENSQLREAVKRRTIELEQKNRELEIERSLEKVRAIAMGMKEPAEMLEICKTIAEELTALGVKDVRNVQTAIIYEQKGKYLNYEYYVRHNKQLTTEVEFGNHSMSKSFVKQMLCGPGCFFKKSLKGQQVQDWYAFQQTTNQFVDDYLATADSLNYYWYSLGPIALGVSTYAPLRKKEQDLFSRFRQVFELSYRRYLDIENAEAQAREAQVELALERVRAKTMAMQKSSELPEAASLLFQQMQSLGMPAWSAGYCIWDDDKQGITLWMSSEGVMQPSFHLPLTVDPSLVHMKEAYERKESFHIEAVGGDELREHYRYMRTLPGIGEILDSIIEEGHPLPLFQIFHCVYFSQGFLLFITYEPVPDAHPVFKRFGNVFDQTYTRFLDLQKAEMQTREATIEASLERVRAKAMAMHKSADLTMAVTTVFEELDKLNLGMLRCGIGILHQEKRSADVWTTAKSGAGLVVQVSGDESMDIHPLLQGAFETWLREEDFSYVLQGDDLSRYYQSLIPTNYSLPEHVLPGTDNPDGLTHYYFKAHFQHGGLFAFRESPFPAEAITVIKRFASVFNLTYKRFLDLQQAEMQAREARIETALERVRSVAMSMMQSRDLLSICRAVFTQLQELGFTDLRAAQIYIRNDEEEKFLNYDYSDQTGEDLVEVNYNSHPNTRRIYDVIRSAGDALVENVITKTELDAWKSYLYNTLGQAPEPSLEQAEELHYYLYSFGIGAFGICSFRAISQEDLEILKRFRNVFSLSYQRYADIALAEVQARQANIEAAMEKVRSRAMAMQKPGELVEVAQLLRREMGLLGVEELETSSIYIHNDSTEITDCWYAIQQDKKLVSDHMVLHLPDTWVGRQMLEFYRSGRKTVSIAMQGDNRKEWINYCAAHSGVLTGFYEGDIPDRVYHLYKFSNGFMGAASPAAISPESWDLLQRATSVFSLAYTRFNDLKIAEDHARQAVEDLIKLQTEKQRAEEALAGLRATQTQLIQAEKMASLGQLTAGIAHEIQNPLNFVNNFSEVSEELIREMIEEADKGNMDEVKAIAGDLVQNLAKINHHGRRADSIVKGMLEHSRTNAGTMEPTDINALADEYLRLSYHGFRAKDKSFNTAIHTDFDSTIGKINIVGQDMARVLLNLYNNAFYAVNEKKKTSATSYEPAITVHTKAIPGENGQPGILISVEDNGNGIPQAIVDKIFQPFFTTKPTGSGTGLGLSLAYDIIKAHGGDIHAESREGEGSAFLIRLMA